jgi:hypothetical protein
MDWEPMMDSECGKTIASIEAITEQRQAASLRSRNIYTVFFILAVYQEGKEKFM